MPTTPMSRRTLLTRASIAGASVSALSWATTHASPGNAGFYTNLNQDKGEIKIYTFYAPFFKEVGPMFQKESGIKVTSLGTTAANEEWWTKVNAGEEIDLVVATLDWTQRAMAADLFLPVDTSQIANTKNLIPEFQKHELITKDDKTYGSPYSRVYYAMAYNTKEFSAAPDSWGVTWDEKYKGKIALHDQAQARVATTALYLGDDGNNPTKWDEITEKLVEQKPLVLKYWTDYQNGMELFANGEALVGQLTAGRARMAMANGAPVNWTVPKEGCMTFVDNLAIPKTSKNPEGAHAFINYLQSPEISAKFMEMMRYDTLNEAARKQLDPKTLETFKTPDGANLVLAVDVTPETRQKFDETWTEVKLM